MTISHLLESFDGLQNAHSPQLSLSEDSLEDQKLASFENGYKAGWDDAVKAQADESSRISSDFAQNLGELSFTYHEAYSHMIKELKPLLSQVVSSILPEIARKSLGAQISEQLVDMAAGLAGQDIEVVVSPHNAEALRSMLENDLSFPVKIVEEESLGEGQAYLRFGQSERQIDNQEVLSGIATAVDAFFHEMDRNMQKKEA
jgi:flagellar assembly protein FliH